MIDPLLSLAFTFSSGKGIYALLLGSGVSRSAEVPTGWEIVLDLIRKLALLNNEDCEPNPEVWYKEKYREDPNYGKLLDNIAKSPTERNKLLRFYFEPTEDEVEQKLKIPTLAHKSIAELVKKGYIKVIITTNFDRLMEKALEEIGIVPTVISTPDAAEGAIPLTHEICTILKVNGDYIDTRIKNTPDELKEYDERINKLLDKIFDEYGLIVCGWSAEWDFALRCALERCQSHRFTTFWAYKDKLEDSAEKLIQLRKSQTIKIDNADVFFNKLCEMILSLEEASRPHPLSKKIAVATLKRYLKDKKYEIDLHELIMNETEKVYEKLSEKNFPTKNIEFSNDLLLKRLEQYESILEILSSLFVTGCYWSDKSYEDLWVKSLERIANSQGGKGGYSDLFKLSRYPALLLIYAGGISAISNKKYNTFSSLLTKVKVKENHTELPFVLCVWTDAVMDKDIGNRIPGLEKQKTPISDYLYTKLRNWFLEVLPDNDSYQKCFDRFEYLYALVYVDLHEKKTKMIRGPIGCFGYRDRSFYESTIMCITETEARNAGNDWEPLKAGLFDGSIERFLELKRIFDGRLCEWFDR